jgi:anti-sigma regulatory factor (Ser/Thr protein kinase)
MLAGLGEAVQLHGPDLHDIRTAVSEACNNVVQHAYGEAEGPLQVEVSVAENRLEVVVRDRGRGLRSPIRPTLDDRPGLGIPIIQTLAQRVHFRGAMGRGTEVEMTFSAPGVHGFAMPRDYGLRSDVAAAAEPANTVLITLMPALLARTVLVHLLSALSERAHFSGERVADSRTLAAALVDCTPAPDGLDRLNLTIASMPHQLSLRLGPLRTDCARGLVSHPALVRLAPVLEPMASASSAADSKRSQILTLTLAEPRSPAKR